MLVVRKNTERTGLPMWFKKVHKYLLGSQEIFGQKIPKYLIVGLLGIVLMYLGVAGAISITAPWLARGDGSMHVDYAWRLYHGDIPHRTDHVEYKPFIEAQGRAKPQAAAKNPPLFYAIHAPLIGPLLDSGHWQLGIALGRFLNIMIGIVCIITLSWGGGGFLAETGRLWSLWQCQH